MWLVVICKRIDGDGLTAFTIKASEGEDVFALIRKTFGMSTVKNVLYYSTKKKAYAVAEDFNTRH